jgi:ribosomal protein S27AE
MTTLHDAFRSAASQSRQALHGQHRLPACPQCGDMLLAPLLAEHVNAAHVRNHWACESCGHTFRKSFTFELAEDELV